MCYGVTAVRDNGDVAVDLLNWGERGKKLSALFVSWLETTYSRVGTTATALSRNVS
jgi:hypothetical protein